MSSSEPRDPSAPSPSAPSNQKADQLTYQFFKKTLSVISAARLASPPSPPSSSFASSSTSTSTGPKADKWFALETPSSDAFKSELAPYRHLSTRLGTSEVEGGKGRGVDALVLELFLDTSGLSESQILMVDSEGSGSSSRRVRLGRSTKEGKGKIVLERWVIDLSSPQRSDPSASTPQLSTIYKQCIPLFRSLYALLRLLPLHKLHRRTRKTDGHTRGLKIGARVFQRGHRPTGDRCVELEDGLLESDLSAGGAVSVDRVNQASKGGGKLDSWSFESVQHIHGTLNLEVTFRPNVNFTLHDKDSFASSTLLNDTLNETYFTPTMARYHSQRSVGMTAGVGVGGDGESVAQRERRGSFYGEDRLSSSPRPSLPPIQAFRSGVLSSSPRSSSSLRTATQPLPSSQSSSFTSIPRSRSSFSSEQQPQSSYPPLPPSTPSSYAISRTINVPPSPIAPTLAKRYSSSFGHRAGRSLTSSSSIGSMKGMLAGSGGSSKSNMHLLARASLEADEELREFMQLLDSRPQLATPFAMGSSSFLKQPSTSSSPNPNPASSSSLSKPSATTTTTKKSQLSEQLQRMAGSYTASSSPIPGLSSTTSSSRNTPPPFSSIQHSPPPPSSSSLPTSSSPSSAAISSSPSHRAMLAASSSSPIAPSPLRSSTEPPPQHRSSSSRTAIASPSFSPPRDSPSTIGRATTSTSMTATPSSPPFLRSPRERRAGPVLIRGGFGETCSTMKEDADLASASSSRSPPHPMFAQASSSSLSSPMPSPTPSAFIPFSSSVHHLSSLPPLPSSPALFSPPVPLNSHSSSSSSPLRTPSSITSYLSSHQPHQPHHHPHPSFHTISRAAGLPNPPSFPSSKASSPTSSYAPAETLLTRSSAPAAVSPEIPLLRSFAATTTHQRRAASSSSSSGVRDEEDGIIGRLELSEDEDEEGGRSPISPLGLGGTTSSEGRREAGSAGGLWAHAPSEHGGW